MFFFMNTRSINIGNEDLPKMAIIGDYWDASISSTVPGSRFPFIRHLLYYLSLNKYMGLKRKGMLHMELLQPPMLLYQPMILLRLLLLNMGLKLSERKLGLRNNGTGYAT